MPARLEPMVKIERILCPTDLTTESDEALRYGAALAREYKAGLILCHCARTAGEVRKSCEEEGRSLMRRLESSLATRIELAGLSGLDWKGFLLEGDNPGLLITRLAAAERADLIVMRTRRGLHAAALLGPAAETVCRTAPCSVLLTHTRRRERVGPSYSDLGLRRVLVAHDFSDRSELALQHGLSLACRFGAELHLLHVLVEPESDAPELAWVTGTPRSLYHTAVRRLQEAVPFGANQRRTFRQAVISGRPYEEVLSYASQNDIDLICVGADGADFAPHSLFGSNADRVIRQAPCSVLVARTFKPATGMIQPRDLSGAWQLCCS